jgi:exopolysaccharide biosynthesis protein
MKNIWSVISNNAVVDKNTNSISLFDCLEEITVNFSKPEDISVPQKNIPINFTIVSLWSDKDISKDRKFEYLLEIKDPENKKIKEFTNFPVIEKGKKRLRTLVQMNGMGITSEGEYTLIIKYRKDNEKFVIASKIPLDVKFVLNTLIGQKNNKK